MKLIMENWREYLDEDDKSIEESATATTLLAGLLAAFNMTAGDTENVAQVTVGGDKIEISAQDLEGMSKVAMASDSLSDPFTDWASGIIKADKTGGNTVDIASELPTTDTVTYVGGEDEALLGDLLIKIDNYYSNLNQADDVQSPYGAPPNITDQQAIEQLKLRAKNGGSDGEKALQQLQQMGFNIASL
tara:strand:+ start:136 stop:702 length:567 start_codon:yes stop_codon:yes gene_type:complete